MFFRFLLVIVLSVLRYTDSDHHVDIFNSSSKPLCQEIKMYGVFEAFSVSCLIRTILQYYILLCCSSRSDTMGFFHIGNMFKVYAVMKLYVPSSVL